MDERFGYEPLLLQFYRGARYALCFNALLLFAMLVCLLTPRPLWYTGLVVGFSLGAAAGSCFNHLYYRLSRGIPVVSPPNHCPVCLSHVKARHNVPVAGWLMLRGRCALCRSRIPPRYLLTELCGGAIGAGGALAALSLFR